MISPEGLSITDAPNKVEQVGQVLQLIDNMRRFYKRLERKDIEYAISAVLANKADAVAKSVHEVIIHSESGRMIRPKTLGQRQYVDAIAANDVVFAIGPAGTGKTYLAMAMAVKAFKNREVNRIILTRPAVEAGESLGFLPGDLQNKVDPYLRPLYDALFDIMGYDNYQRYVEKGMIEVAPLAYMRGRTLDKSFIILDEAQNTTNEQMKMFLTRSGFGSKVVITGDVTQIDLPKGKESGLKTVSKILMGIKGLEFVILTGKDIVRHPMVQRIIEAYDKYENREK
ncbi:MAG: PhoH family protein [Tissierellia bacterium]|nr:PhoH family protein [Tissierellia bacterium]